MKGNKVLGTIPGSFASRHIKAGDIVMNVNGEGMPRADKNDGVLKALKSTRDAIGTRLSLTVSRNGVLPGSKSLYHS